MPLAAIHRKLAQVAVGRQELAALAAMSHRQMASLIEPSYAAAAPDLLEIPANPVLGEAITWVQVVSPDNPMELYMRLQGSVLRSEQPTNVTGVEILSVTGGAAGTAVLDFVVATTLLSWQAPGESVPGTAVDIGLGGSFTLTSGDQSVVVFVTVVALPVGDQSDSLDVAPGYHYQPREVTGVTVLGITGGKIGTGTLTYTAAGTLLKWQSPGAGGAGADVNIGAGGVFEIVGTDGQTLRVQVVAGSLPAGNENDLLVVGDVDDLVPLTLVPTSVQAWLKPASPLFVKGNTRVVFEPHGLANGNSYSIFINLFDWVPSKPWNSSIPGT